MMHAIEQGVDGAPQGNNGADPMTAGIRYDVDTHNLCGNEYQT
jgi:hypothetical protein